MPICLCICRLRYDNEAGKGDHKHIDGKEEPLNFTTIEALLDSFWREVMQLTEES
ncbi:toxin-antitoxin system TumE family protein [Serratia marcescens]